MLTDLCWFDQSVPRNKDIDFADKDVLLPVKFYYHIIKGNTQVISSLSEVWLMICKESIPTAGIILASFQILCIAQWHCQKYLNIQKQSFICTFSSFSVNSFHTTLWPGCKICPPFNLLSICVVRCLYFVIRSSGSQSVFQVIPSMFDEFKVKIQRGSVRSNVELRLKLR